jgi:Zn-dependent protease with chaperone function
LKEKAGAMVFCRLQISGLSLGFDHAHVAQLVEHILGKDEVISSILIMGSSLRLTRSQSRLSRRIETKADRTGKTP